MNKHEHRFGGLCMHEKCVQHRREPAPRRKTQTPGLQPARYKKNKTPKTAGK